LVSSVFSISNLQHILALVVTFQGLAINSNLHVVLAKKAIDEAPHGKACLGGLIYQLNSSNLRFGAIFGLLKVLKISTECPKHQKKTKKASKIRIWRVWI
jgi:hypothetical protein